MTPPPPRIEVFPTVAEAVERTAQLVTALCQEAHRATGRASLALSGGNTPKALYSRLASADAPFREAMPWNQIHFFWGDERSVPSDHPDSNFKMAWDAMLSKVPANAARLHRFRTELADPELVASDYEDQLGAFARATGQNTPRLDVTLLGMGADGHTASLFPGTNWENADTHWVKAFWVEKLKTHRFSLLPSLLNESGVVLLLVTGAEKAKVLAEILGPEKVVGKYPVQSILPTNGEVSWILDDAAAGELK